MNELLQSFLISVSAGMLVSLLFKAPVYWMITQLKFLVHTIKEVRSTQLAESNRI